MTDPAFFDDYFKARVEAGKVPVDAVRGVVEERPLARLLEGFEHLRNISALVPEYLARGFMTLLVAPGGTGKSTLAIQFAIHGALGSELGRFKPREPFRTLIVSYEDSYEEIMRRTDSICGGLDVDFEGIRDHLSVIASDETKQDDRIAPCWEIEKSYGNLHIEQTRFFDLVKAEIRSWKPDLVILDALSEAVAGVEENAAVQMMRPMQDLRGLARDSNAALLILHHPPKVGSLEAQNTGAGSRVIEQLCRFAYSLEKMTKEYGEEKRIDDYKNFRRLIANKANFAQTADDFWLELFPVERERAETIVRPCFRPADAGRRMLSPIEEWEHLPALLRAVANGDPDGAGVPWSASYKSPVYRLPPYLARVTGITEDEAKERIGQAVLFELVDHGEVPKAEKSRGMRTTLRLTKKGRAVLANAG